jgi:hypothetical protein
MMHQTHEGADFTWPTDLPQLLAHSAKTAQLHPTDRADVRVFSLGRDTGLAAQHIPGYTYAQMQDALDATTVLREHGINIPPACVVRGPGKNGSVYVVAEKVEDVSLESALAHDVDSTLANEADEMWARIARSIVACRNEHRPYPLGILLPESYTFGIAARSAVPRLYLTLFLPLLVDLQIDLAYARLAGDLTESITKLEAAASRRMEAARVAAQHMISLVLDHYDAKTRWTAEEAVQALERDSLADSDPPANDPIIPL